MTLLSIQHISKSYFDRYKAQTLLAIRDIHLILKRGTLFRF